jgi:hypothetical protein
MKIIYGMTNDDVNQWVAKKYKIKYIKSFPFPKIHKGFLLSLNDTIIYNKELCLKHRILFYCKGSE